MDEIKEGRIAVSEEEAKAIAKAQFIKHVESRKGIPGIAEWVPNRLEEIIRFGAYPEEIALIKDGS